MSKYTIKSIGKVDSLHSPVVEFDGVQLCPKV